MHRLYRYVNADWIAATPAPASGAEPVDIATGIEERNQQALIAALQADKGGVELKALYRNYVDRAAVEALGLAPLAADFAFIESLSNEDQLAAVVGQLARRGVMLPLRISIRAFDDQQAEAPSADTMNVTLSRARRVVARRAPGSTPRTPISRMCSAPSRCSARVKPTARPARRRSRRSRRASTPGGARPTPIQRACRRMR